MAQWQFFAREGAGESRDVSTCPSSGPQGLGEACRSTMSRRPCSSGGEHNQAVPLREGLEENTTPLGPGKDVLFVAPERRFAHRTTSRRLQCRPSFLARPVVLDYGFDTREEPAAVISGVEGVESATARGVRVVSDTDTQEQDRGRRMPTSRCTPEGAPTTSSVHGYLALGFSRVPASSTAALAADQLYSAEQEHGTACPRPRPRPPTVLTVEAARDTCPRRGRYSGTARSH